MSMHLHHPALSTSGKKKGKPKFRNAAEAQRARDLAASWDAITEKHNSFTLIKKITKNSAYGKLDTDLSIPAGRDTTAHIKSRVTTGGSTALPPAKIYTGSAMLGVAQLHKSNAIPVFRNEDVIDISKMRR